MQDLSIKAQGISHTVGFYQEIVRQLSVQDEVKNIVMFSGVQAAQEWAAVTQKLLPESIGLALFDGDGNVLGQPAELSLGSMCLADMEALLSGQQVTHPAVHAETAGKQHFDVTENIMEDGEVVGIIFASFSLRTMQHELDRMVSEGEQLSIMSNTGMLVAQSGVLGNNSYEIKERFPISGSDWYLQAIVDEQDLQDVLITHAIIGIVLLVTISAVFYYFSCRLVQIFSDDFDAVLKLLKLVRDNRNAGVKIRSRLLETKGVVQEIRNIAEDISGYQQHLIDYSVTDDLTGLFNRRAFYQEMIRFMDLAGRDEDIVVVTLDLDHLKQINDSLGHETGDQLLIQFANTLRARCRETDYCARVGGDEFWVVLVKCTEDQMESWYRDLAKDFQARQRDALGLSSGDQLCGVSAGYTSIKKDEMETKNVLKRADEALYRVKSAGRGNIQGFNE
ncbi:MAG: diguanylate cyclase [Gammaproteobacteria bacterium]|nr:diguanylate cyclase [Gammaproteobacteria bacterium]